MDEVLPEALKEIWKSKFQRAKDSEFDMNIKAETEIELLRMKIDMCLDKNDKESFEKLSKKLKSIEFFLSLKSNQVG